MILVWLVYFFFLFFFFFGFDENGFYLLLFSSLFLPNLLVFLFRINKPSVVNSFFSSFLNSIKFFVVFNTNFGILKTVLLDSFSFFFKKSQIMRIVLSRSLLYSVSFVFLRVFFVFFEEFKKTIVFTTNLSFRFCRLVWVSLCSVLKRERYLISYLNVLNVSSGDSGRVSEISFFDFFLDPAHALPAFVAVVNDKAQFLCVSQVSSAGFVDVIGSKSLDFYALTREFLSLLFTNNN